MKLLSKISSLLPILGLVLMFAITSCGKTEFDNLDDGFSSADDLIDDNDNSHSDDDLDDDTVTDDEDDDEDEEEDRK